jgi:hypothetical protein
MASEESKSYWVVEFRFPILVQDAEDALEAQAVASVKFQKEYNIKPSAWFARIFEYGPSTSEVGPLSEYFFNPNGATVRKIDKNDAEHGRLYHEKLEKDGNNE